MFSFFHLCHALRLMLYLVTLTYFYCRRSCRRIMHLELPPFYQVLPTLTQKFYYFFLVDFGINNCCLLDNATIDFQMAIVL